MTGHCGADNGLKALPWASRYLPDGRFRADDCRGRVSFASPRDPRYDGPAQAAAKAAASGCGRSGRERVWKQNRVATKNGC